MWVLLLSLLVAGSQAFLFGSGPDWDGLRVTFGIKFWDNAFDKLPRTKAEAIEAGFTLKDSQCVSKDQKFRGYRYWLNNDPAVYLLFDKNGYIAGIQTAPPKSKYTPTKQLNDKAIANDGDNWVLTAYFVEPSKICDPGRSADEFEKDGTGNGLWLQNGTKPDQVVRVPNSENEIKGTEWGSGKCFPGMGQHYWFNIRKDMDCDDFFPYCVLYTGGKLNAFCFAIDGDIETSSRYEHPGTKEAGGCCLKTPDCFDTHPRHANNVPQTTMHVYLTDAPWKNLCPIFG